MNSGCPNTQEPNYNAPVCGKGNTGEVIRAVQGGGIKACGAWAVYDPTSSWAFESAQDQSIGNVSAWRRGWGWDPVNKCWIEWSFHQQYVTTTDLQALPELIRLMPRGGSGVGSSIFSATVWDPLTLALTKKQFNPAWKKECLTMGSIILVLIIIIIIMVIVFVVMGNKRGWFRKNPNVMLM